MRSRRHRGLLGHATLTGASDQARHKIRRDIEMATLADRLDEVLTTLTTTYSDITPLPVTAGISGLVSTLDRALDS